MATFAVIPWAPDYAVGDDGSVWTRRGRPRAGWLRLALSPDRETGYVKVNLTLPDRSRKSVRVHVLVAELFLGPRPAAGLDVCHRDGVRSHNRADNLEYGTKRKNAADRLGHEALVMNAARRAELLALAEAGLAAQPLADHFGISVEYVRQILANG